MKPKTKTMFWMAVASLTALLLVLVCLHHQFWGPVVGGVAVTLIWLWLIFKLAAVLDSDLATERNRWLEEQMRPRSPPEG